MVALARAASRYTGLLAVSVLAWSGLESACRQILSLLFFFAAARFITPADLGVFSLGVALTGITAIVIDEPIGEALVQQHSPTAADWDTGYTLNIGLALLCLLVAILAGPLLATLLHQPSLRFVIPVLAFGSVIGSVGNIHKSFLSRSLKFRLIAQTALAAQLCGGLICLVLAAYGFGYWALVANVLAAAFVTSVVYRVVAPWRPRLRIDPEFLRARGSYIGYSAAIRTLYLLRDQSLFIVAGSVGSLATVGYLGLGMRVARALGQLFEEVTSRPLISLVSRHQNELPRFRSMLVTILEIVGLLAFPCFVGLAAVGTPLIAALIGPQWAAAGQFLPWICIGMGGWLFLHIVAVFLRARGLGRIALGLAAPTIILDAIIFTSASVVGLDWALRAWAIRAVLSVPILAYAMSRHLGLPVRTLVRVWTPPVLASLLMLLGLEWLKHRGILGQGSLGLAASILAAAALYAVAWLALAGRGLRSKLPLETANGDD